MPKRKIKLNFDGYLDIAEKDILKFYPDIKPLLGEIKEKKFEYRFRDIKGKAKCSVDLDETAFMLFYRQPRGDSDAYYSIEAELGGKGPANIEVLEVENFQLGISLERTFDEFTVDPVKKQITNINNIFWNMHEKETNLSGAKKLYEAVKWFKDEKKYELKGRSAIENYKKIVDAVEKPLNFNLSLSLTVEDNEKVPSYDILKEKMIEFLGKYGILGEVEEQKTPFLDKPIP